jgi:hypothetical protein
VEHKLFQNFKAIRLPSVYKLVNMKGVFSWAVAMRKAVVSSKKTVVRCSTVRKLRLAETAMNKLL